MKPSTLFTATVVLMLGLVAPRPLSAQTADAFFSDTVVQDVYLSIHAADWQQLRSTYTDNTYYPADLRWNGQVVRNVGIRSRGSGSRSDRKPGLRMDIDRYATDQRFLGLKSFVLDNVTQDASLIKERLAMRVFERLGLPAPRETHARLYINNVFFGVYVLVESVDKDFVARVYAADAEGASERDGYLFEYRWLYPFYFSYPGPDLTPYGQLFEARTHEEDSPDVLYGPLRDLCRLIADASDEDFVAAVGAYLDVGQFVRYVAVENFLGEVDGALGAWGMNNFYLYRFEGSSASQVIAWDKDSSFSSVTHPVWYGAQENVLMRRAMAVPALRTLYLDTLVSAAQASAERLDEDSRGWLAREVDRAVAQIDLAVKADTARLQSQAEFEAEVARVRAFAQTRSAFVECEVANARDPSGSQQPCGVAAEGAVRR